MQWAYERCSRNQERKVNGIKQLLLSLLSCLSTISKGLGLLMSFRCNRRLTVGCQRITGLYF